ncbi:transmembrane protein 154 [Synchiropus splendidus]|uniref:transmembrane protein 154 n=1 Tax=Synchiropus splendidus TaxID=270530 RepID=UPI00237D933D|nr:transmembrane protein 154 [Synchiropus splendidus]
MSRAAGMRAPRGRTPRLLLLLLLLAAFRTTVFCQIDDAVPDEEVAPDDGGETSEGEPAEATSPPPESSTPILPTELTDVDGNAVGEGSGGNPDSFYTDGADDPGATESPGEDAFNVTIILIPVVLVFLIIAMIAVGLFISRRWNSKAANKDSKIEDTYMDASTSEKVPMPMFEEDVPSVLELEMEELDQWINPDS